MRAQGREIRRAGLAVLCAVLLARAATARPPEDIFEALAAEKSESQHHLEPPPEAAGGAFNSDAAATVAAAADAAVPSQKSRYRDSYDAQPPVRPAVLQADYTDQTKYSYYKDKNLPSFMDWRWEWQDAALSCRAQCSGVPTEPPADPTFNWPANGCTGRPGSVCSAQCTNGGTTPPQAVCSASGSWQYVCGSCIPDPTPGDLPPTCDGPPQGSTDGFTWPLECFGSAVREAGGTCTGTCNENYGPDCTPPLAICLADGSWNTVVGGCKPKCSSVPVVEPPNPNVVWEAGCSGALAGGTCQGYCSAGSAINPSVPLATCGADGNWTIAGGCSTGCSAAGLPITDGSFTWPTDGSCDGATAGGNCTGQCTSSVGFQPGPGGAPTAVCNMDGTWSLACGACIEQGGGLPTGCAGPPSEPGVSDGFTWPQDLCDGIPAGDTCEATCATNFGPDCTPPIAVCLPDGSWNVLPGGACRPKCAVSPPTQPNVNWEQACNGTLAGSTCQGYCGAGSVVSPSGPPVATCSNTGEWAVTGGCETGCSGVPPSPSPDGSFTWPAGGCNRAFGQTCVGTCAPGFGPRCTPPTATCQLDGNWSTGTGACIKQCTDSPPAQPNVNWEQGCNGTLTPGTCQGYCGAGSVVGPSGPPVATCSSTGEWNVTGGCRTGCSGVPPSPSPDGSFTWPAGGCNRTFGQTCVGTCAPGFGPRPTPPTATCQLDGNWSTGTGACIRQCTDVPPAQPNVNWQTGCPNTLTPGTCQGSCGSGSVVGPNGPPVATCGSNGQWNVTGGCITGCSGVPPSPSPDGSFTWPTGGCNRTFGQTCVGTCAPGFGPRPTPPTATCQLDGNWSTGTGACIRQCTDVPPARPNVSWQPGCPNTLTPGTCQGNCSAGSVVGPNGPPVATCGSNGQWNVTGGCLARCTAAPPVNSSFTWPANCTAGAVQGTTCQGTCGANQVPSPTAPVATCSENGTWNVSGGCRTQVCRTGTLIRPNITGSFFSTPGVPLSSLSGPFAANPTCGRGSNPAGCTEPSTPIYIFTLEAAPVARTITVDTCSAPDNPDTMLYARPANPETCAPTSETVACNDNGPPPCTGQRSTITFTAQAGVTYYIFLKTWACAKDSPDFIRLFQTQI